MKAKRTTPLPKHGKSNSKHSSTREVKIRRTKEKQIRPIAPDQITQFLERISDGFVAFDAEMNYTYVNPRGAELLGRTPEDLIGKNYWVEYPEAKDTPFAKAYVLALKTQKPILLEAYYSPWNRWFENRIYPSEGGLTILFTEITEWKQTEEAQKKLTEQLSRAQHIAHLGFLDWDLRTNEIYLSDEIYALYGLDPTKTFNALELITQAVHSEDKVRVQENLELAIQGVQPYNIEHRIIRPDGKVLWVLAQAELERDSQGQPRSLLGVALDITERKQAEILMTSEKKVLEMIAKEEPLSQILDTIARNIEAQSLGLFCTILLLDPDGIHMRHGAAPSIQETFIRAIDGQPIGPKAGSCGTAAYLKEPVFVSDIASDPLWDDYREVALNHDLRACWSTPIQTPDGKILGTFAMYYREPRTPRLSDLHLIERAIHLAEIAIVRKKSEETLRESEALYRQAIEVSGAVPYYESYHDQGTRIEFDFIGEGIRQITGYGPEEFTEQLWDTLSLDIHLLDDLEGYSLNEAIYRVRSGENPVWKCEHRIRHHNGEIRWVFEAVVELRDDQGNAYGSLGMFQDITKRKHEEEILRVSQQRLRLFFNQSLDGFFFSMLDEPIEWNDLSNKEAILDYALIHQHVTEANDAMINQYGSTREKFLGRTPSDFFAHDIEQARRFRINLFNAGQLHLETEERRDDGTPIWVEGDYVCMYDAQKRIIGIFGIQRDVTTRKQAEAKILRQLNYLTALKDIDRIISSTFDVRVSLNSLVTRAISVLAADAVMVLLVDPVRHTLEYGSSSGFRTNVLQTPSIGLGESYAGRVALEQRTLQIPDTSKEPNDLLLRGFLKADQFVSYFGTPLIVKGKVVGVFEVFNRSVVERDEEWLDFFGTIAGQAAIAIDNAKLFEELKRSNFELLLAYDATIEGWSHALDLRDKETKGHTLRVTELSLELARQMGLSESELIHVRYGALLHDIGKMGIPDGILLKPGPLTDQEQEVMKKHPTFAYELLSPIRHLKSAALDIPYCHHEKWDGTGYPRGLKGQQIPLTARIFAVVDVWDAITSDRPYRQAWTHTQALKYIQEQSGSYFDPQVVKAFLRMIA